MAVFGHFTSWPLQLPKALRINRGSLSNTGSTGVLQLAVATGQWCWLVQQPFPFQIHLTAHSVDSQGSCQQQGVGGGLSSLSMELGRMLRGECLASTGEIFREISSLEKALGRHLSVQFEELRNWGKTVWKRQEGEERRSRAVVCKVCELLINLPDMQDLLLVTTDVFFKPLAKNSSSYRTAIHLPEKNIPKLESWVALPPSLLESFAISLLERCRWIINSPWSLSEGIPRFTVAWWPWESCRTHGICRRFVRKESAVHWKIFSKMLADTMTISNKLGKCILWKTAEQKEVLLSLFFNNFPSRFLFLHLFFPDGCPSGEMSFWARTKDWVDYELLLWGS